MPHGRNDIALSADHKLRLLWRGTEASARHFSLPWYHWPGPETRRQINELQCVRAGVQILRSSRSSSFVRSGAALTQIFPAKFSSSYGSTSFTHHSGDENRIVQHAHPNAKCSNRPHRSPPSPARRERFSRFVALLFAVEGQAPALQYTRDALLPAAKTDTLWGVMSGVVFGFILSNGYWEWTTRRTTEK